METGVPPSAEMLEYSNWTLLEQGRKLSALDLMSALKKVNAVSRSFAAFFENHDIWLTPTMGALPPLLGYLDSSSSDVGLLMTRFSELYRFNPVYNASGLPAMTLPLHFSRSGLPIGMMFGAGFGKEAIPVSSSRATGACDAMDRSPPSQSLDVTANRRRMGAIVSGPRLPRALLFATGKHPRANHHSSADRRNHPFRGRTIGRVRAQSAVMPPNQPAP